VAVMHEAAYQYMVKSVSSGKNWDDESCEPSEVIGRKIDEILEDIPILADVEFRLVKLAYGFPDLFRVDHSRLPLTNMYDEYMEDFFNGKISREELVNHYLPLMHDTYALVKIGNLSLPITPMLYASQDYCNDVGREYAALLNAVEKEISKNRNDE
jgi:hypothetical protein